MTRVLTQGTHVWSRRGPHYTIAFIGSKSEVADAAAAETRLMVADARLPNSVIYMSVPIT